MTRYIVYSEEYGRVEPVLDFGQGPMEYGRDVWEGEAKNKAEARRLAYTAWRDRPAGDNNGGEYIEWNRSDGRHPMSGVTVEEIIHESTTEEK